MRLEFQTTIKQAAKADETRKQLEELKSLGCRPTFNIKQGSKLDLWNRFKYLTARIASSEVRQDEAEWIINQMAAMSGGEFKSARLSYCKGVDQQISSFDKQIQAAREFIKEDLLNLTESLKVLCKIIPNL